LLYLAAFPNLNAFPKTALGITETKRKFFQRLFTVGIISSPFPWCWKDGGRWRAL